MSKNVINQKMQYIAAEFYKSSVMRCTDRVMTQSPITTDLTQPFRRACLRSLLDGGSQTGKNQTLAATSCERSLIKSETESNRITTMQWEPEKPRPNNFLHKPGPIISAKNSPRRHYIKSVDYKSNNRSRTDRRPSTSGAFLTLQQRKRTQIKY